MDALTPADGGRAALLAVKAVPGAKKTSIEGMHGEAHLRVRLQAPPVDGAANEALVVFAARVFSLRASDVELVRGEKSRLKTLRLGLPYADACAILARVLDDAGRA